MKPTQRLKRRILEHLLVGGAVASTGCVVKDEATPETERGDAATDATTNDGDATDTAVADAALYPPVPEACEDGCCELVHVAPIAPGEPCVSPDDPEHANALYQAVQEVTSLTDFEGDCCLYGINGPFQPEEAGACAYMAEGGPCPVIGRPFYVKAAERRAPAVARADWV